MRARGLGFAALLLCIGGGAGQDVIRAHTTAAYRIGRRTVGLPPAALDLEAVGACDLDHSRVLHRRVLVAPVDQLDVARTTDLLRRGSLGGLVAVLPRECMETVGLEEAERLARAIVRAGIRPPAYFVRRDQTVGQLVDTLCDTDSHGLPWQVTSTAVVVKPVPRGKATARAPLLHALFALPAGVTPGPTGPPLVLLHALSDTWCSLPVRDRAAAAAACVRAATFSLTPPRQSLCPLADAVGTGVVAARALFSALGPAAAATAAAPALLLADGAAPGAGAASSWLDQDAEGVRDRIVAVVHLHSLGRGPGLRVESRLPPSPPAAAARLAEAVAAAVGAAATESPQGDRGDLSGAVSVADRRARRAVQPFADLGLPVLVVSGEGASSPGGSQLGDTRSQVQDTALGASLDSLLGALLEGLEAPGEARRAAHLPPLPTLGQWMDTVGAEPRPLAQAREGSNASASAALLRQWGEPVGAEGGHVAVSAHEAGGSGVELYPIPSTLALALYPVSAPAFDIALATAVVGYLFSIYVASRVVAYGRAATL